MIDVPFLTPRWKKILLLTTILVSPFDNFLCGGKDNPMQNNLQKTRPLTMLVQVMRNQPQGAMEEGKKVNHFNQLVWWVQKGTKLFMCFREKLVKVWDIAMWPSKALTTTNFAHKSFFLGFFLKFFPLYGLRMNIGTPITQGLWCVELELVDDVIEKLERGLVDDAKHTTKEDGLLFQSAKEGEKNGWGKCNAKMMGKYWA